MNDRETILASIQEALKKPSVKQDIYKAEDNISELIKQVMPPVGESFDERLALFRKNAQELKAEFYAVNSTDEVVQTILKIKDAEQWKSVATHPNELTESICNRIGLPILKLTAGYDITEFEKCSASITVCDCLVAQTGSVVVSSASTGGRAISVLPPHHIVIAKKEQLAPTMSDAIALVRKKYNGNFPSMVSFITGPSRTGDIERILVLGAHGPKRLTIFLF